MEIWNNMYQPGDKKITPLNDYNVTNLSEGCKNFYTCDGKPVATIEEVLMYNQMFYERMKIQTEDKKGMHK